MANLGGRDSQRFLSSALIESLMFRVCSDTLSVNELTDRLTDPWHAGPKRQPKLDEAWEEHYKNQDQYQKQKTDKLLDIFRAFLQY